MAGGTVDRCELFGKCYHVLWQQEQDSGSSSAMPVLDSRKIIHVCDMARKVALGFHQCLKVPSHQGSTDTVSVNVAVALMSQCPKTRQTDLAGVMGELQH